MKHWGRQAQTGSDTGVATTTLGRAERGKRGHSMDSRPAATIPTTDFVGQGRQRRQRARQTSLAATLLTADAAAKIAAASHTRPQRQSRVEGPSEGEKSKEKHTRDGSRLTLSLQQSESTHEMAHA
jgi:hypothetical protein